MMARTSSKPSLQETPSDRSFTEASQALQQVLEAFRKGNIPLEEAIALFEEGTQALHECQKALASAEGKIQQLCEKTGIPFDLEV
ncbi:MAG: exodeoxyribonuclease VII small subunit [Vampirovibrionales bacterium]